MAGEATRIVQVSLRLNEEEAELLDGLLGYRGLYERSDILRHGIQLVSEAEQDYQAARGGSGAARRRRTKTKGEKS